MRHLSGVLRPGCQCRPGPRCTRHSLCLDDGTSGADHQMDLARLSLFAVTITNLKNILAIFGLLLRFVGSKWPQIVCSADLPSFQVC